MAPGEAPNGDLPYDEEPGAVTFLPVVQIVEGTFQDGELTFRNLEPDELVARGLMQPDADASADGVAVDPLVDLPSYSCTPTTCTGTEYVAISNVTGGGRAITHGVAVSGFPAWTASDVPNCGPIPGAGSAGVCRNIQARNLYSQQLERVYFEVYGLTPAGSTTSVAMSATQPFAASPNFGLSTSMASRHFRMGEMGRSSPTTGGQAMWWAFSGTTTGSGVMTFSFLVQVHGLVVSPTQRASLANGLLDDPTTGYPARTLVTPASVNIAISEDARYVAFATATAVYRKDMSNGTLTTVASGCTTASHPHLSADGSVLVFQASGCDLSGLGSTTASPQVYARDFTTGTTQLISRSTTAGYGGSTSSLPRVSADGVVVVFQSAAVNLMPGTPASATRPGCVETYRYNRSSGTMSHASAIRSSSISVPTAGWDAGCTGSSTAGIAPDVSGDGNLVVFSGLRPLDTVADTDTRSDVYVYNHAATVSAGLAVVYRVSVRDTGGPYTLATSTGVTISADGALIAFGTDATNVITGTTTTASRRHIYRRSSTESAYATIVRIDRRVDGAEPSATTTGIPALSRTGRFVAFWSGANDMASSGSFTVAGSQVYVCDTAAASPLNRCWVASTMQPTASGGFSVLAGVVSASSRIGMAYPSDVGAGYVAYQGAPSTGTWASAGAGGQQIFVSPIGDPRYQQVTIIP